ncbi:plasmid recombination enzyme [Calothrix sp. NIES-4101]|nr:plasmid recombination enzyme [Calothrix sp. NIES-4101]
MTFAICRIQKIKSWGQLKTHEAHTIRMRNISNANLEVKNVSIIEPIHNLDLITLVREKIGSQKIRSNAVIAVEMLLSASAKYFRPYEPNQGGSYDKHRLDNFTDAVVKWLDKSWGNRIIRADLHLDEMTPHIHAFLVPLDEWGKLNCKALFGNRDKMYELQDSFAAAVAHLGIMRGIRGSVATHEQIRKYYAAINQDSQILDLESCLPQPQPQETGDSYKQRVIEVLNPQLEVINYQLNERSRILQQITELKQTAFKSEQLRQQLERELKTLRITGIQRNLQLPVAVEEIVLPVHSPQNWHEIEDYLTQKRRIPQKLLHTLHQRSLLYADIHGNAVFVTRNLSNEATGAYLHKPVDGDRFMFHTGSNRDYGWFHLIMGGHSREPTTQAILVSSPIEALSLVVLNAPHKSKTMYLVCDFQLPVEFLKNLPSVIVAMNREHLSLIDKFLPTTPNIKFLDIKVNWNQQLQEQRSKNHAELGT